jgi:hypothetical protein
MFTKQEADKTDEYNFLRERAAQLLDEGKAKQAMEMLNVINEEQIRLLKPLLVETYSAVP